MTAFRRGGMWTLDSVLDNFEEYVNRVGVDGLDLQQFVHEWQSTQNSCLGRDTYLELLRVWMEYAFHAGNRVSVEQALSQLPDVDFDEAAKSILEFERRRLDSTWSEDSSQSQPLLGSLPIAPVQWEDFDLVAELGEGAFARVYLARQKSMAHRLVALKITSRHTRESHWLARLQHSAVVPIYSIHRWGPLSGVCMPYLGNTTLADLLREQQQRPQDRSSSVVPELGRRLAQPHAPGMCVADGKSLLTRLRQRQSQIDTVVRKSQATITDAGDEGANVEQEVTPIEVQERTSTARELSKLNYVESVAWIGSQLANALEHAHRLGIVHCDIKPANVLLAADGQPRLLDFNVAQEPNELNQASQPSSFGGDQTTAPVLIGGTPGYMAPEQVRLLKGDSNCVLDGRADIYALGVVLFELLAGRLPGALERVESKSSGLQKSLRTANRKVTPALAAIIVKCLAEDRTNRYQSATELYEDLNAHVHHLPLVHQREPSLVERLHKWRRRHPAVNSVGSIASLAAVLVLVTLGWALQLRDSRRLMAVELNHKALVDELEEAIPRVTAAREYTELHDDVQRDAEQIAAIVRRLVPHPVTAERLSEFLPEATQLQLVTYAQLFQVSSQAVSKAESGENQAGSVVDAWVLPSELVSLVGSRDESNKLPLLYQSYLAGDPVAVIAAHRHREALVEGDFAQWLFIGHSFMQLEQWTDASEAYTHALAINPELAIARFYRGISRMKDERWIEAAEDFAETKRLQPSLAEARFNLAQVQKRLGQVELAEAELSEAIRLGWHRVTGYYTRAALRKRLGDIDGAKADYEQALNLPPRSEADWLQLAALMLRNEPARAEQYYREAIHRFPNSRIARQNLAHVLSESLGRPQEAIEVLTELIAMRNPLPEYYAGRSVLYARQQRVDVALADLQSAEKLDPKEPLVQYQMACGYSLLANASSASNHEAMKNAAIHWYFLAVASEPQLSQLADSDQDLSWLRNQAVYNSIQRILMP